MVHQTSEVEWQYTLIRNQIADDVKTFATEQEALAHLALQVEIYGEA